MWVLRLLLCFVASCFCCAAIYGDDSRRELFEVSDPELRRIGRSSVVAFVKQSSLKVLTSSVDITVNASFGQVNSLCPKERFWSQVVVAQCTGVLIGRDRVLTAGHCVDGPISCGNTHYVFGLSNTPEGALKELSPMDVFSCRRVWRVSQATYDHAIIQLDRPTNPDRHHPIQIADAATIRANQAFTLVGFSGGLGVKVTDGIVIDPRASLLDYFVAACDTFHGGSGSPALIRGDDKWMVAGVVSRGEPDFVSTSLGCQIVNRITCERADCSDRLDKRSERFSYAFRVRYESPDCNVQACPVGRECLHDTWGMGWCEPTSQWEGCRERPIQLGTEGAWLTRSVLPVVSEICDVGYPRSFKFEGDEGSTIKISASDLVEEDGNQSTMLQLFDHSLRLLAQTSHPAQISFTLPYSGGFFVLVKAMDVKQIGRFTIHMKVDDTPTGTAMQPRIPPPLYKPESNTPMVGLVAWLICLMIVMCVLCGTILIFYRQPTHVEIAFSRLPTDPFVNDGIP